MTTFRSFHLIVNRKLSNDCRYSDRRLHTCWSFLLEGYFYSNFEIDSIHKHLHFFSLSCLFWENVEYISRYHFFGTGMYAQLCQNIWLEKMFAIENILQKFTATIITVVFVTEIPKSHKSKSDLSHSWLFFLVSFLLTHQLITIARAL